MFPIHRIDHWPKHDVIKVHVAYSYHRVSCYCFESAEEHLGRQNAPDWVSLRNRSISKIVTGYFDLRSPGMGGSFFFLSKKASALW